MRNTDYWEVLVEKQLADETPEQAKAALARRDAKLGEIGELLPTTALQDLQRVKVFLMHGPKAKGGGRESGLEYFPAYASKHHDWVDARMASSIVIFSAENWVRDALGIALHIQGRPCHHAFCPGDGTRLLRFPMSNLRTDMKTTPLYLSDEDVRWSIPGVWDLERRSARRGTVWFANS